MSNKNLGIYLNTGWTREYHSKWLQGVVKLQMYKGKILLSVASTTPKAQALGQHANIRCGGDAWMDVRDVDAIIELLREARQVLRMHARDVAKIVACERCCSVLGGTCDKHRVLFEKYKPIKKSRRKVKP